MAHPASFLFKYLTVSVTTKLRSTDLSTMIKSMKNMGGFMPRMIRRALARGLYSDPGDPEEQDFLPQSGARVALSEHGFPTSTPHPPVRRGLSTDPGHGYVARLRSRRAER